MDLCRPVHFLGINIFLKKMEFTPCKGDQPLRGMEFKKKKDKKIKTYRKIV